MNRISKSIISKLCALTLLGTLIFTSTPMSAKSVEDSDQSINLSYEETVVMLLEKGLTQSEIDSLSDEAINDYSHINANDITINSIYYKVPIHEETIQISEQEAYEGVANELEKKAEYDMNNMTFNPNMYLTNSSKTTYSGDGYMKMNLVVSYAGIDVETKMPKYSVSGISTWLISPANRLEDVFLINFSQCDLTNRGYSCVYSSKGYNSYYNEYKGYVKTCTVGDGISTCNSGIYMRFNLKDDEWLNGATQEYSFDSHSASMYFTIRVNNKAATSFGVDAFYAHTESIWGGSVSVSAGKGGPSAGFSIDYSSSTIEQLTNHLSVAINY